jgi:hypothetical protein
MDDVLMCSWLKKKAANTSNTKEIKTMFENLKTQMTSAFRSNQLVVCIYKRTQYVLVDMHDYNREAFFVRNTPESIARFNANSFECGDELALNDFELTSLKVSGLQAY